MSNRDLLALAGDPDRITSIPREDLPRLLGDVERLRAELWAALTVPPAPPVPESPIRQSSAPDRLLTAKEAADALGVSPKWIYRKAGTLPFTRRLSGGTLRFSLRALERWKESRR